MTEPGKMFMGASWRHVLCLSFGLVILCGGFTGTGEARGQPGPETLKPIDLHVTFMSSAFVGIREADATGTLLQKGWL